MLFARIVLLVQVLVLAGLGLAYWLKPYEMANLNGMLLMETGSVSNTRVYYGGLQLGLALFLLWSMRRLERLGDALVLLILLQSSLVLARLGSLWLDGGVLHDLDLSSLLYKLVSAGLAALALYRLRRELAEPPLLTERIGDDGDLDQLVPLGRPEPRGLTAGMR